MRSPQVSVIMPTYNRAKLLPESLNSVLGQTHLAWELIVVDDGSTDDSYAVVNGFKSEKIQYFQRSVREGAAGARNYGLAHASESSEYVAFLDSDDLWSREFLQNAVDIMEANPEVSIFHADAHLMSADGTVYGTYSDLDGRGLPLGMHSEVAKLIEGCYIPMVSVVLRRRTLERLGLLPNLFEELGEFASDYACWLNLMVRGVTAYGCPVPRGCWRRHPAQLTTAANGIARLENNIHIYESIEVACSSNLRWETSRRKMLSLCAAELGFRLLLESKTRLAKEAFEKSVTYYDGPPRRDVLMGLLLTWLPLSDSLRESVWRALLQVRHTVLSRQA